MGLVGDVLARQGRLLEPVPVIGPAGQPAGWVVGIEIEDRLLGLIQLDEQDRFRRYASFLKRPGSIETGPRVGDWFDRSAVLERVSTWLGEGAELEEPILTFDRHPDRLVWMVRVTSGNEKLPERVFVAGDHVYVPTEPTEPTTG